MTVKIDPRRFGGIARVYGEEGAKKLSLSHILVVGLGGVGSWAVESLVRSGIGEITIIDGDIVELSNTNRQLHALDGNYGKEKALALKERLLLINPDLKINVITKFITSENIEKILSVKPDWVMDCIDDINAKVALIASAKKLNLPIVSSGGAGGKVRPEFIHFEDLALCAGDPLLSKIRTLLRKNYGFPRGSMKVKDSKKFGVMCAYSSEPLRQPNKENNAAIGVDEHIRVGFGSAMVVTASVGLRLASFVINSIVESN